VKKTILAISIMAGVGAAAAAVPAAAQNVHRQESRQEQRIRQGERTGRLTRAEASRLQYLEARVRRTEMRMRMRHGGRLTYAARRRLEAMIRRDNREIYRLKHNYRRY
jgi:TolA-binding protein